MLSPHTEVADIASEHERVSCNLRVILILSFLYLRRADALVGCVIFPRLLAVGVGCVCSNVILVHAATIIPKHYVLDIFFCVFGQNPNCQCIIKATRTIGSHQYYIPLSHTDTDTDTDTNRQQRLPSHNFVTTKTALTCVIEHYADLDQPAECLILLHIYDGLDRIVNFFGHGKRQQVATMLALLQGQVLVPACYLCMLQCQHFASAKHEQDTHLLIDAIATAILFRYGTWVRQAVYREVIPFHPSFVRSQG